MTNVDHATSSHLPPEHEWAADALRRIEGDLDPSRPVHDVAEGWSRPGGTDSPLLDAVFVLTADRLGIATPASPGRWVPLGDIAAVDAVDDSPLPLQTIEFELTTGEVVCVGWPESFSGSLVDVLERIAAGRTTDDLASPVPSSGDVFSASAIAEVSVDDAPPPAAKPIVAAIDFLNPADEPAPAAATVPLASEPESAPESDPDPGMFAFDVAAADHRIDADPTADAWFSVGDGSDPAPAPTPASFVDAAPPTEGSFADAPDLTMPAPDEASAAPIGPGPTGAVEPPPWQAPGMAWPDPVRGVVYLGGHPSHPRKRKNGTMRFSPVGLEVRGSGFHDWEMTMDWGYVDQLDVQGPDEVMFGDQLKIDSSSSAVIVVMNDGTRMVFEVRTRRPPSLRSAIAPVLLMVGNIRSWRAQLPHS